MEKRICNKCKKNKPITNFKLRHRGIQGERRSTCRSCSPTIVRQAKKKLEVGKERRYALRSRFGDKCEICGEIDNLNIDHDHNTQEIRGILCRKHNWAIGLFQDNSSLLRKAAEYLEKSRPDAETMKRTSENGY